MGRETYTKTYITKAFFNLRIRLNILISDQFLIKLLTELTVCCC
jgi:hypothetical protein